MTRGTRPLPRWLLLLASAALVGALALLARSWAPQRTRDAPARQYAAATPPGSAPIAEPPASGSAPPVTDTADTADTEAAAVPPDTRLPQSTVRPGVSALRAAFERQAPDATAAVQEAQIRDIYARLDDGGDILRSVRCTKSVCRLELHWSRDLHASYDHAQLELLRTLSTTISIEPEHDPQSARSLFPISLFIARPGHSVASLLAEEAPPNPQ